MAERRAAGTGDGRDPHADDRRALRIGGIVLAAGRGVRMGGPKTTLVLEGRTLLEHAIDSALASRLEEVVVVLRPGDTIGCRAVAARADARLRAVVAPDADGGQARSLAAGLDALGTGIDAAAILLADQPGIPPCLVDRIAQAAAGSSRPAVRPVHVHGGARVPGHPVVLARRLFAKARALEGDEGARALWRDDPTLLEEIEIPEPAPPDIDTPDDWTRLSDGEARRHD
jgi:molybdenum cofactor cytidylyltransferase